MESHRRGDLTEAVVVAELKRRSIPVSKPVGDNERYDLIAESGTGLWTFQVKTGWFREGTIRFHGKSQHTNSQGNTYQTYDGDVDYFVVYCDELDRLYLIEESAFNTNMRLRVAEPAKQDESINWADECEFDRNWPPEEGVASPTELADEILAALKHHDTRAWLPSDPPAHVDALVTAGERYRRVRFKRGGLVDGRVRFATGDTDRPPAEDDPVDDVLIYCSELDELYAVARDEYETSMSLRVANTEKLDSRINWADKYRFATNWPPQTDS